MLGTGEAFAESFRASACDLPVSTSTTMMAFAFCFGRTASSSRCDSPRRKARSQTTPLADVLPVRMPGGDDRIEKPEGVNPSVTAEHEILREIPTGETVIGDSFALDFGGKGANQAVMSALLGASVSFVGCVGQDVFGEMIVENLESFGIDASRVARTTEAASGAAPIWVDASGENRIIVVPGANDMRCRPFAIEAGSPS